MVALAGHGGSITANRLISNFGQMYLSSEGNLSILDSASAEGSITLLSGRNVSIGGDVVTKNTLKVSAVGAIRAKNQDPNSPVELVAQNNITLTAVSGGISTQNVAAGRTLSVSAAQDITGDLAYTETGDITIASTCGGGQIRPK